MNELTSHTSTIILMGIVAIFSFQGFRDSKLAERLKFQITRVSKDGQFYRMFSSALLHENWSHLVFNLVSLALFAPWLESKFGGLVLFLVFFLSVLGGDSLSLWFNRNNPYFHSRGASGGVSGVILATVFLFPSLNLTVFGIEIGLPAYMYAFMYMVFTIFEIKLRHQDTGHEYHMGGAFVGMSFVLLLGPTSLENTFLIYFGVLLVLTAFLMHNFYPRYLREESQMELMQRRIREGSDHHLSLHPINSDLLTLMKRIHDLGMENLTPSERLRFRLLRRG